MSNGLGILCFDDNGDICRSLPEMIISNILIKNNLVYNKEKMYKEIFPSLKYKWRMDWYLKDFDIAIEYFGMYIEDKEHNDDMVGKYSKKVKEKLNFCHSNNINIFPIFPNDINEVEKLENRLLQFLQ
jgi:hypothetical protein